MVGTRRTRRDGEMYAGRVVMERGEDGIDVQNVRGL